MHKKNRHNNINCNIHTFINSTLITIVLIITLLFISAHWNHTKIHTSINIYSFIATQKSDTWRRYPTNGQSIPNLNIRNLNTFLVCCSYNMVFACAYGASHITDVGFESSIQHNGGHTFLVLYAKSALNGTNCKLTWQ